MNCRHPFLTVLLVACVVVNVITLGCCLTLIFRVSDEFVQSIHAVRDAAVEASKAQSGGRTAPDTRKPNTAIIDPTPETPPNRPRKDVPKLQNPVPKTPKSEPVEPGDEVTVYASRTTMPNYPIYCDVKGEHIHEHLRAPLCRTYPLRCTISGKHWHEYIQLPPKGGKPMFFLACRPHAVLTAAAC